MTPRPAATVILMRDGARRPELLMVQRTPAARFMPGRWVFPGGAVDPADGAGVAGLRAAALRELAEEASVRLDAGSEVVPFARWITPAAEPIRFDAWFFLAVAPAGVEPKIDGTEIVALRWSTAVAALSGELQLALPTRRQLELLSEFESASQAVSWARERVDAITPVEPRVVGSGADARIVLPDES